ncbi:hypothetical protein DAMA08_007170 [Martiniozyma asiatica (nom. inval.)]|nr:hypothetical protein DAMA08_007170 [Martiniozyma asiatica]
MYIRAAQRTKISNSIFSTTFLLAFSIVLANSIMPCPVDRSVSNDDKISTELREELIKEKNKARSMNI